MQTLENPELHKKKTECKGQYKLDKYIYTYTHTHIDEGSNKMEKHKV